MKLEAILHPKAGISTKRVRVLLPRPYVLKFSAQKMFRVVTLIVLTPDTICWEGKGRQVTPPPPFLNHHP